MKRLLKVSVTTLVIILTAAAVHAQTISYDFNEGQSDFRSNFQQNTYSQYVEFGYSATGGLADSGKVQGPGSYYDAAFYKTALTNDLSTHIHFELFFKTQPTVQGNGGDDVAGVGFSTNLGNKWYNTGTVLVKVTTSGQFSLVQNGSEAGDAIPALAQGQWYEITADFTNTGSSFNMAASLFNYGPTGTSVPVPAGSIAFTNIGSGADASQIFAGIYGGTGGGQAQYAQALDNLGASAITVAGAPEPSTWACMMVAGVLGMAARRLRTKKTA